MTKNQLEYHAQQENIRNHMAVEAETERHNRATEDLNTDIYAEQARHNLVTEALGRRQAEIDAWRVSIQQQQVSAQERVNLLNYQESMRHNLAAEANQRYVADLNTDVGLAGNAIQEAKLYEEVRHNQAMENYQKWNTVANVIGAGSKAVTSLFGMGMQIASMVG